MNKTIISYSEYSILIDELLETIKDGLDLSKIEMIYTFIRGGLPIAVHLSHALNIKMFSDESDIYFPSYHSDTILVVDDIADTGKTLNGYHMLFPTATLFYKPRSVVKPTFYVRETTNWIVFPWELVNEKPNR
ncbi:MAG TPA: hypothetical protein VMX17_11470 [Candidatus Glassbacteria bacterium]|nr:hypothetical protein [Candidatus Glassbacteria bacterium]